LSELGVWADGGCSVCADGPGETRLVATGRGVLPELSGGVLPELSGGVLQGLSADALPELASSGPLEDCDGILLDGTGAQVAAVPEVFSQATAGVLTDGGAGALSSAVGSRLSSIFFRISASKSLRFSGLEKARDTST
jgi:hypothetical protein